MEFGPRDLVQDRRVEQIVDGPVPQVREQIGEVNQLIPQERVPESRDEQIDVSVPQIREQCVEIVKAIPLERSQQRSGADYTRAGFTDPGGNWRGDRDCSSRTNCRSRQTVEASVRKIREQIVEVVKVILQEQLGQHTEEFNMNRLVPQIDEEMVEGVQNVPHESILERVVEKIIVVRGLRVLKELMD